MNVAVVAVTFLERVWRNLITVIYVQLQTPWNWVLERVPGVQLLKDSPAFYDDLTITFALILIQHHAMNTYWEWIGSPTIPGRLHAPPISCTSSHLFAVPQTP
jgi:hypothetical protein